MNFNTKVIENFSVGEICKQGSHIKEVSLDEEGKLEKKRDRGGSVFK